MKAYESWTILPHGPVVDVADGVWRVDGTLPDMPLPRRMTLVRRSDGTLLVHNAIAVDDSVRARIESLGQPSLLLVPSAWHRLDAPAWLARYPSCQVLGPRGALKSIHEVVRTDGDYDSFPPDPRVKLTHWDGTKDAEGIVEVSGSDGVTLVVNDAIFNLPHMKGLAFGLIYGRLMGNFGAPRVSFAFRAFVVKHKRAFRAHLARLAALPHLQRIVMSHGEPIVADAAGVLRALSEGRTP